MRYSKVSRRVLQCARLRGQYAITTPLHSLLTTSWIRLRAAPKMFAASHWYTPESFISEFWTSSLPPNTADRPTGNDPFTRLHTTLGAGLPLAEHCNEAASLSFTVSDWGLTMTSGEERDSPGSPLGPGIPGGPASPFSPWAPFSPAGPMMPCLPAGPGGPMMPRGPALPDLPFGPLRPRTPWGPGRPGGPGDPGTQTAPFPAHWANNWSIFRTKCSLMESVTFWRWPESRRTRDSVFSVSAFLGFHLRAGALVLVTGAGPGETPVNQSWRQCELDFNTRAQDSTILCGSLNRYLNQVRFQVSHVQPKTCQFPSTPPPTVRVFRHGTQTDVIMLYPGYWDNEKDRN